VAYEGWPIELVLICFDAQQALLLTKCFGVSYSLMARTCLDLCVHDSDRMFMWS